MTGIYRSALWYNRVVAGIIRFVHRRSIVAALTLAAASAALAQGEPEQRTTPKPVRTLGVDYGYANFQGDIDAWHLGAISLVDKGPRGTFIGRVNIARRFAQNGTQAEVDAYPNIAPGLYAYLNLGYSRSSIFPGWRSGGELFKSLPRAYEASLGYRQLRFGGPPVTLLTGAVGRYTGNYWFSLRPFIRDKQDVLTASAILTGRRYTTDADNYVGARVGYGSSPSDDIQLSQLTRLNSSSVAVSASRATAGKPITTWSVGLEREELSAGRFRNRWQIDVGLKFRR